MSSFGLVVIRPKPPNPLPEPEIWEIVLSFVKPGETWFKKCENRGIPRQPAPESLKKVFQAFALLHWVNNNDFIKASHVTLLLTFSWMGGLVAP